MSVAQWQSLGRTWTFDDLQDLPDDVDRRCFEIIDGSLVVSPTADYRHETIVEELRALLRTAGMPPFRPLGSMSIDLEPSYLVPDVVVVDTERVSGNPKKLDPSSIALAVEIVSPGSRTMDRLVKPTKYAQFGVPHYWRVETDPLITVTAYDLDGDTYREIGTWGPGQTLSVERPFPVRIPVDAIPRPA